MNEKKIFDAMRNAFEPLRTGAAGDDRPGLPQGVTEEGGIVYYRGARGEETACSVYVREDGPDAWGNQVIVPAGGAYRMNGGAWRLNESGREKAIPVEYAGTVVDVAYIQHETLIVQRNTVQSYPTDAQA